MSAKPKPERPLTSRERLERAERILDMLEQIVSSPERLAAVRQICADERAASGEPAPSLAEQD